jgi:hypothetical protein
MSLLVRVFFALLLGYVLARLLRRPTGPAGPHRSAREGLDPDRAVRASWSEVEETRKEEPGER